MTAAAVVAAIVALVSAALSFLASRRATNGARDLASINHRIAVLDREGEQYRDDYRAFMEALGDATLVERAGAIVASGEVLRAHPRTTDEGIKAIDALRASVARYHQGISERISLPTGAVQMDMPTEPYDVLHGEFRAVHAAIAEERLALVDRKVRTWPWQRRPDADAG